MKKKAVKKKVAKKTLAKRRRETFARAKAMGRHLEPDAFIAQVGVLQAVISGQQKLIEQLCHQVAQMKRDGYQPAAPQADFQVHGTLLPAAVMEAVEQRANEGTSLWDELITFARSELRKDKDPEAVASMILRGSSHEDYE